MSVLIVLACIPLAYVGFCLCLYWAVSILRWVLGE